MLAAIPIRPSVSSSYTRGGGAREWCGGPAVTEPVALASAARMGPKGLVRRPGWGGQGLTALLRLLLHQRIRMKHRRFPKRRLPQLLQQLASKPLRLRQSRGTRGVWGRKRAVILQLRPRAQTRY